ncbi:MAG: NADH/ubiquinone/plastoquinone (complex I) [Candidatus Omnitrophica bacterium]|nr:NADH/ubiquinone/plastoquinone (complex I) [Candidatus Omnitrophota bacterium]
MNIIPLFIAIPLGFAFLIPMFSRKVRWLPDMLGNLATLSLVILSFYTIGRTGNYYMGGWRPPIGINLVLDGFSSLMLIMVSGVSFAATLFSVQYMEKYTSKLRYYSLFLLMVAGMNGVALTGDMFNLYVFLEIASIASYALVGFGCDHEELEASFKYLVLGSIASTFILFGIALIYGMTGSLNMAHVGQMIQQQGMGPTLLFAMVMFLMGFGLKAALVPFHAWLPDAHPSAPAPISAMLSGVLIKVLGVYAMMRIFFNVIGVDEKLSWVFIGAGVISMVVGGLLALGQWDYKRLLAYSSISQMGYVILAIGVGGMAMARGGAGANSVAALALLGGLFHLINHATFKSLMFLTSGSVVYGTNTRDLKKMGGLFYKMPITGLCAMVGSLSIAGLPPFNGFWSKLIIILACVKAGFYGIALVAVAVSVITLAYYLKLQKYAFFGEVGEGLKDVKESPSLMCLSMGILAVLCVGLSLLLLPGPRAVLLDPAVEAVLQGTDYITVVLGR